MASNDGVSSVTKKCAIYRPARNNANSVFPDARNLFFVDTVGWDDPDANDDETFKDILLFIKNNNIANLKAVVWTGKNIHIFQKAQVTIGRMVHKKRHQFLDQFSIPFRMVCPVLLQLVAQ